MRHLVAPALFAGLVTALTPDCWWRESAESQACLSCFISAHCGVVPLSTRQGMRWSGPKHQGS